MCGQFFCVSLIAIFFYVFIAKYVERRFKTQDSSPPIVYHLSMHCLLVGNYGVGNLGDEALKEYFLRNVPHVRWTVVSAHPQGEAECARLPGGFRSFFRFQWLRTLRAYHRCDAVVFGGGSLFTDVESVYACILWWLHARVARFFGKPVHLGFQGIGPFRTRVGERFARSACAAAASLSVRDARSATVVHSWNLNTQCVQTFDPVFLLMHRGNHADRSKKVFTIIPRRNSGDPLRLTAQELLKNHSSDPVRILCLQYGDPDERRFAEKLAREFHAHIQEVKTLDQLIDQVSRSSFVVAERYHGALAALALGVPFRVVSQASGDKLSSLLGLGDADVSRLIALVEAGNASLRGALKLPAI